MTTGTDPTTRGSFEEPGSSTTSTSTSTKDQAQQAAGTAAEEGKHVAGVAQDEAQKVAGDVKAQAHSLLSEATSQLEDQSRTQRDRLASTLRSLGDDLQGMAQDSNGGLATDLARQVADRAHDLSSRVDGREPRELLDDVRQFARRKPGTFLLGALAAGVVAGRLTRGTRDAADQGTSTPVTPRGTATGTPVAGTDPADRLSTTPVPATPSVTEFETTPDTDQLPNPASSVHADAPWTDRPAGTV